MPVVSEAQRRLMYAAKEGKVKGVSPKVGSDFINASQGVTDLPKRVTPKRRMVGKRKPQ